MNAEQTGFLLSFIGITAAIVQTLLIKPFKKYIGEKKSVIVGNVLVCIGLFFIPFSTSVLIITSSNFSCPIRKLLIPVSFLIPNNLCILGFRRSSPIRRTFIPDKEIIAARFAEINVLPSAIIVELTEITGLFVSLMKYLRLVLADLKDSASVEPGFSTTGISELRLL